jgi:hypothetical protein
VVKTRAYVKVLGVVSAQSMLPPTEN